jgi:hypothetical protein
VGNTVPFLHFSSTLGCVKKLQLVTPPPGLLLATGASLQIGSVLSITPVNNGCSPLHPLATFAPFATNNSVAFVSGLFIHGSNGLVLDQYTCVEGILGVCLLKSSRWGKAKVKDSMAE